MHGLINKAIQSFVCATYGRQCWLDATQAAGLDFEEFEAMLIYESDVSTRVLDVLCAKLNRPKPEFLEDLGTYLVSHPNTEELRRLLRERAPLYAKASYNVVTSGRAIESVVEQAVAAVRPHARARDPKPR